MSLNLPENSESAQQREILDALPVLVFLERAGRIVFANAVARKTLGLADGESIQRPVEDVLWGFSHVAEPQTPITGGERGSPFHATLLAPSGRLSPIEGIYCILNPELHEAIIVAQHGGERAPESHLMEDVLASIPEAIAIVRGHHVLYTNSEFTRMFGYTAEELNGASLRDFIVPETRQHEYAIVQHTVDQHGRASLETVRKTKSGELVDVSLLAGPLVVDGARVGFAYSYRDIGERKQMEEKLQHDAMHDVLTGLPNRALFLDRLTLALTRRARRKDLSCGLLFLDLDNFKEVNDTLGHAAGDILLLGVAERLRAALRPQDSAARLGGDEFAILVENILNLSDLSNVATRVLHELERPFEVFGHSIRACASIGVAMAGPDHLVPESLIRDADFAMYRAKQDGGGRFEIFDRHLEVRVSSQQQRERELRHVLDKRQFEIWYQPIFRLENGKLEGFESLMRWRRADGSIDSFRDLLSVAEDTGLSISIGRETTDTVCRQLRNWNEAVPQPDLTLTVNLSSRQFFQPDMVAQLGRVVTASRIDPAQLLFEVSETTLNGDPDAAVAILQRMVDINVRIAVDNFGSSLAPIHLLSRLPIDVVKLDPRMTIASTSSGKQVAVVEAVIQLSRALGVQVVAQGIETRQQLDALRRLGCEMGQGFLMSGAVEPATAWRIIEAGSWKFALRN
jgi:Amt family ammonium transporter